LSNNGWISNRQWRDRPSDPFSALSNQNTTSAFGQRSGENTLSISTIVPAKSN